MILFLLIVVPLVTIVALEFLMEMEAKDEGDL